MTGVPGGGPRPGMGASKPPDAEEEGRVGPFPNWTWVYSTVVVYGVLVIAALLILTRLLNY